MSKYRFLDENKEHIHQIDRGQGWENLYGTTTAIDETLQKGGLTWWASSMAVGTMGWLNPKKFEKETRLDSAAKSLFAIKTMDSDQYLDLLDEAYKSHNTKKLSRAKEGIDLHELAEEYIKYVMGGKSPNREGNKIELLVPFIKWCDKNVKRFLFSEIHAFSEKLWVGGKLDFGAELVNGDYILADIKSRDSDYLSDHIQCGFYDLQLSESKEGYDKDGNVVWKMERPFDKHAIFTLGEKFTEPKFSESVSMNKEGAIHTLALYKIKQRFEND